MTFLVSLGHATAALWQADPVTDDLALDGALKQLSMLRQAQHGGKRVPHKPLLVLLALGRFTETGSSAVPWSMAQIRLADLIAEFAPPSRTRPRQSAAYPFTRLRTDEVWVLDRDVPDDLLRPLDRESPTGQLSDNIEDALRTPGGVDAVARDLIESHFPMTVGRDVLVAVGLDPDEVYASRMAPGGAERPRRSASWPSQILTAWDNQCAFCGYDGHLGSAAVGLEAAHVRWFNLGGPDAFDNGLALCSLHHKLFDRGALGLDPEHRVVVSRHFTARTEAAKRTYELHGHELQPRRGTPLPAFKHTAWHVREVFKGEPLTT
jgi:putative restriction endonuclease